MKKKEVEYFTIRATVLQGNGVSYVLSKVTLHEGNKKGRYFCNFEENVTFWAVASF